MQRNTESSLPEALRHFDSLPDSAHVKQPVVEALRACSSATVWRHVHAGLLPKPHRIGRRAIGWNVGELRAVLNAKAV